MPTYPFKQLHASVVEDSRLSLDARIVRVLTTDSDHCSVEHWRRAHALKGRSMDDGESGMKEPPVIVKILLKQVGVRDWTHTVLLLSKEYYPLLFIPLQHCLLPKVSIS